MRRGAILLSLFLCVGYLLPEKADAIPYFARKYSTQCTMCHVQPPMLNSTGQTFKQNGYRLKGEEGEFIWQDKIFPISGKVTFEYKMLDRKGDGWINEDGRRENGAQSIFLLDEMRFFSAGTLAPRVSYFLDFGSEDEDEFAPGTAFIIFDDILPDGRGNIKAGKFYNEFLYLSEKRRLTLESYMAPVTRTQYGVEFNGDIDLQGIRYAIGVANDEMTTGTTVDDKEIKAPGQTPSNFKYVSNYVRAFYGWATYNIFGHTIGFRGYTARAGEDLGVEEDHTQIDVNLNLHFDPAIFTLAYYIQSNVNGAKDGDQNNLLSELILKAGPQLILDLRYETQNKDTIEDKDSKYILNGGYYPSPNIGLIGSYVKQDGNESQRDEDKLQVGVQIVF